MDLQDDYGRTALLLASKHNTRIVLELLDAGWYTIEARYVCAISAIFSCTVVMWQFSTVFRQELSFLHTLLVFLISERLFSKDSRLTQLFFSTSAATYLKVLR